MEACANFHIYCTGENLVYRHDNNANIESLKKNITDKLNADTAEIKKLAKDECVLVLAINSNNLLVDDDENNEINNNDEDDNENDLNVYNDV